MASRGPGHWETRTRITIVNGKKKATTYRVWVPDKPQTGDAAAIARARARAEAAKKRAALAAKARAEAAAAKKAAEEHAAYLKTVTQRRRAAILALKERTAARNRALGIIREEKVKQAEAPSGSAPVVVHDTPTSRGSRYTRRAKMAKTYAQKYAEQTARKIAAQQKENAYLEEKRRLLGYTGPRGLEGDSGRMAPGKQMGGIKTNKDAASAERLMAEEARRAAAGKGSLTPEEAQKLWQKYNEYANRQFDQYVQATKKLQQMLDKADNTKLSAKKRMAWYEKAREYYYGDFAPIAAEYVRLHGEGRNQGKFREFAENMDKRALQQREWWKSQMKAQLQSAVLRMRNDPDVSREDQEYYRKQLGIFNESPQALGQTIDHYKRDEDGRVVPVYRPKTIEEALQDQQAQYILKMQQMWREQQAKAARIATDHGRHGLVLSQGGDWVKADTKAFEDEVLRDANALYNPQMQMSGAERQSVQPLLNMPDMKRDIDLQRVANEMLGKWEERNPEPKKFASAGARVQTPTAEWLAWDRARQAHEYKLYRYLTQGEKGTPGFLERVLAFPGISHTLAAFQGGVSSIGAGSRVVMKITTGRSTMEVSIDPATLPDGIRQEVEKVMANYAPGSVSSISGNFGGAFLVGGQSPVGSFIKGSVQDKLNEWFKTPEGAKWLRLHKAELQSKADAADTRFQSGFYGGKSPADMLDALNAFGSEPFTDATSNLMFQLLADPTNAIPLKFTTYAARAMYASRLAQGASKINPVNWARFARNFVAVDEGVLKMEKELTKYSKVLTAHGTNPKEAAEELRRLLAGLKDDTDLAEKAFGEWATKYGLDPKKLSEGQIFNLAEWAVTKEAASSGQLLTQQKDLLRRLKAKEAEIKAATAARKQKEAAQKAAAEERRLAHEEQVGAAHERLAIKRASEEEAAHANAVAGRRPAGAAREPVGTAPARPVRRGHGTQKPAVHGRPRPTHPVQLSLPRYKGGILTDRLRDVHKRVAVEAPKTPMTEKIRIRRQREYEGFDEYYIMLDGHLVPRERTWINTGWHTPQVRQWRRETKSPDAMVRAQAKIALARHAERLREMFRTDMEDIAHVGESKFTPSRYDVASRARVHGDPEAENILFENLARIRHLKRVSAADAAGKAKGGKGGDPYVMGWVSPQVEHADEFSAATARRRRRQGVKDPTGRIERRDRGFNDTDGLDPDQVDLGGVVETGFQLTQAKQSFQGLRGVYIPFTHHSLGYFLGTPGPLGALFQNLAKQTWANEKLTVTGFGMVLDGLKGMLDMKGNMADIIGDDVVKWRDGGMAMFEIFHQLRRAKNFQKLEEFSAYVTAQLDEDPEDLFAWMWKVMEHRTGMPWVSSSYDEVVDGFRNAARIEGIDPDMALAGIPNGYYAQTPPQTFGLSPMLSDVAKSDDFVPAPYYWNEATARTKITQIFHNPTRETIPSQVVHYVAKRFGDLGKGSPLRQRIIGEIGSVALSSKPVQVVRDGGLSYTFDGRAAFIDAVVSHIDETHDYAKLVARRRDELRASLNIPANVGDEALDEIIQRRGLKNYSLRDLVANDLTASLRPRRPGFRPEFGKLGDAILRAYWDGAVSGMNATSHELMYLAHLQGISRRGGWHAQTKQFMKYMTEIGEADRARAFLQKIHKTEFENLAAKFRAQHVVDRGQLPKDPITGERIHVADSDDWRMWEEMGFDLKRSVNPDSVEQIAKIRNEADEIENQIVRNDEFIAHSRDDVSSGGVNLFSEARMESLVSSLSTFKVFDDNEAIFTSMLGTFIHQIADQGGSLMSAADAAGISEVILKLQTLGTRGQRILNSLRDEIGDGILASRLEGAGEQIAYEEARIRLHMATMLVEEGTKSIRKRVKNADGTYHYVRSEIAGEVKYRFREAYEQLGRELDAVLEQKAKMGSGPDPSTFRQKVHGVTVKPTKNMVRPGAKPRRVRGTDRVEVPLSQRVAARFDRASKTILIDDDVLHLKFKAKSWTRRRTYLDGSVSTPLPRGKFKTYDDFRKFTLEHEYQHSIHPKQPGETRAAYEQRMNELADRALREPEVANTDPIRAEIDKMVDGYMTSDDVAVSMDAAPDSPPRIEPIEPDPVAAAHIDKRSELLEKILGMSEDEWYEVTRQRLRRVVFNRKSTASEKMAARKTLDDISLVQFGRKVNERRGTKTTWRQRTAHRDRVVKQYGDDAVQYFPDRVIAPHATSFFDADIEQVRTWFVQLKRRPPEIAESRVLRLGAGKGRDLDHFPIELFDKVEQEVAAAIRGARGWAGRKVVKVKGERTEFIRREGATRASAMRDSDMKVLKAKQAVLQKYGISMEAYDEARKVLHRGYVQRRTNQFLIAQARKNVDEARAAGKTLDFDGEYKRLRHARAQQEARLHLGELAYGEMYGSNADEIWEEFQRRYGFDHELKYPAYPMSQFQIRTLEEAVKLRSGIDDIADHDSIHGYLSLANRPPFEDGREAVREYLKSTGQWTPRVHDDFVEGKRSWDIDAEAEYWDLNYGEIPDWTNRSLLSDVLNDIFHDDELYFLQMKAWGIFNRSMELQLRLDGTSAKAIEAARAKGDAALDIEARRELEAQRRYVVQRYGDLVGEELGDGTTRLTSMPWMMYPDELAEYMAKRAADHGLPEGLIQSKEELDKIMAVIRETMRPLMDDMFAAKAGGEITYEDIYRISSEIQARLLADPFWRKRMRDIMVGDPLNMWTKFNRWMVFSNPSFAAMNMVDVPIKMAWYRASRRGLFNPAAVGGLVDDALERASKLTPAHLGLDAETTIYRIKQRGSIEYFKNPRQKIRIGPFVIDEARGIGKPVIRAIEYTEGAAHAIPEIAGRTELKGKMHLARQIYPQVYSAAVRRLGDAEQADLFARNFVKNEISRMWPTAGDGAIERLFNRVVPFSTYTIRNKVLFISEAFANPVMLNRIEYIGRYIEQHNLKEWEKKFPGTEMPDYLRRRIELPWAPGFFLDLGSFSDATRGLKPLFDPGGGKTVIDATAEWVRLINPAAQAGIYAITNAMGLTKKVVYVPILDENGFPTGEYEKKVIGWTEPWSKDQPDVGSVFWLAQAVESAMKFGEQGWTTGELSQMVGQVFAFNAITSFDRGSTYFQMFKLMESKNAEDAKAWLEGTPEGRYLKEWMKAKAVAPRDVMNTLADIERYEKSKQWEHWFSLSKEDREAVTLGRKRIKAIRDGFAARLLTLTPGTPEFQETKAMMYYEINREYMMNEALMREEVWSKTPAEWSEQMAQWQTDKLTDDFMVLSDRRPQRSDYETAAEYRKAVEEWENAKALFLKTYPQVEKQLAGAIVELDAAREKMNEMWDETLTRIADRNEMIELAKAELERYGRGTEKGDAAQDRLDILYLQNELDYSLLNRDYAATYFSPQDYERLPGRDQTGAPLRGGISLPRVTVLRDFNMARYEKARREGTLDDFLAKEQYGKDMAAAILYSKGGDKFGEFSGAKFYKYMQDHPNLMEKYFQNNDGKKAEWAETAAYIDGMRKAVEYAGGKWGGKGNDPNFDPAKFVAYLKKHPKLMEAYFKRHKGKREQWARNEAYIRQISVWGKLVGAGRWDEANEVWDNLPQWVKNQYYKNNPGARKRRQQTAAYLGYMKKWISFKDKKQAMAYFNSLPDWAKERYYKKHPEKRVLFETNQRMFSKLAAYFSSEGDAERAAYLRENPDLARWLAKNASTKEKERWAILAAYQNIPKDEAWLRKVFRERYPEIFSAEAKGEAKLRNVYARLRAHPEMSAGFEAWVKAITESYAEMMKKSQPRPKNTYIEMDREPRRKRPEHRHPQ